MRTSAAQDSLSPIPSLQAELEGQLVEVSARSPGVVQRVAAAEDQLVAEGDLLAELDHHEIDRRIAATTMLLDNAAMVGAKPHTLTEAHQLGERNVLSRIELPAQARSLRGDYVRARLERSNAEVRAPVAGRVVAVHVQPWDQVALAQPLFSVLEDDDVWVVASFASSDFPYLRAGQSARVIVAGHVTDARVAGVIGPGTPVLLEFVRPRPSWLRPGAAAQVLVVPD
jgi:multidrug resistance efflux pump